MKFTGFELRRIALPMVAPFETSFGTQHHRDILLVRALSDEAEGWGECVAMDAPLYSSEYADGAHAVLRDHQLVSGRAQRFDQHAEVRRCIVDDEDRLRHVCNWRKSALISGFLCVDPDKLHAL